MRAEARERALTVAAEVERDRFALAADGSRIGITVSIGLAERGHDSEPERLFRRADRALYRSKSSGRNRVSADAA